MAASKTQSWTPWLPSVAVKNTFDPDTTKFAGLELPEPGLMSATRRVDAELPSVTHSSVPVLVDWLSVAVNTRRVSVTVIDDATTSL